MRNQKHTSAATSINGVKLPAAFNKVTPLGFILDYGCGKYTRHIEKHVLSISSFNQYASYDKYNQTPAHNMKSLIETRERGGADMVYCCNVLNVIDNDNTVQEVIQDLFDLTKDFGSIIIQIYPGDKSGKGRETKPDCWQRNETAKSYGRFLNNVTTHCFKVRYAGNIILITCVEQVLIPCFEEIL